MPDSDHAPDLDATIRVAAPNPTTGARQEPDIPQPEELAALLPGENYTVESFLGAGGMGAVYRGTQVRLQRKVAIKIMRRDRAKDQGFEERFRREALAMAQLNHPNIVNVIDYGEAGTDFLYIVMEFIDGTDLVSVIRSGEMTQETALKLLPQICDALQFAHDHGIVHRDIKPANILLTRDGRIKMADFGLAKRFDAENSYRTQSGYGMGTPDYAAPEQFMGDANVDHRADIYALGVMIYQMVTGTLPRGAWKPPSEKAAVDAYWDHIVARALQTDPHDRYASVSEIKTDLGSITPMTGAPRLAADGTQSSKTAGMTAAKGSTTALTQAGGRLVTKVQPAALQDGNSQSNSGRKSVMLLSIAAIVLLAGGYLLRDKFKPAPMTTGSNFAAIRTWRAPSPTAIVGPEWTHLVPHIKPERDAIRGEWRVDEKGLHAKPFEWAFCNIPVQDPGTDYDLRYQVTRGEGSHLAMFFAFRRGDTGGYVPIDYNGGGVEFADGQRWATIEDLTDRDMRDPSTIKAKRKEWLPRGKACTVLLQVREKEVIVSVDGEEAFRWPADWSKIQQKGGAGGTMFLDVGGGPVFGVGIFNCEATFHSIEMRRVGESNASASASSPASATKDAPSLSRLSIRSITPPSPARLKPGEKIKLQIDFQNPSERIVHIWAHPLKRGALSNLATTSGSFPTNERGGTVERWFSYKEAGDADEVRVEMVTEPETPSRATLAKIVVPINVTWTDASKSADTAPLSEASSNGIPFVNTLGMKFVAVTGTKVLFSIWDTRVMDYEKYATARPGVDGAWKTQQYHGMPVGREPDHPVVAVTWEDAQAFCGWLTAKETAAGTLPKGAKYRLPTDAEWSTAAGLPPERGSTPWEREAQNIEGFPWGKEWPPTHKTGNFADEAFHALLPPVKNEKTGRIDNLEWLKDYDDGFATTSPVGRFPANMFGLYDMGGNVWQWCEDWNQPRNGHVLRGGSWMIGVPSYMRSSRRIYSVGHRDGNYGFRCVLEAR